MSPTTHSLDPLSPRELSTAAHIVRTAHAAIAPLHFQAIFLLGPRKAELSAWLADRSRAPRPARVADVTVIAAEGKAYDGFVDLKSGRITKWQQLDGFQPIITLEELQNVEEICRQDPQVIEQCGISGIPAADMHKVYCDPWTIGHDERYGNATRLQQALMYYRPNVDDCQYQYPLDFCPIFDSHQQKIVAIDIPSVRRRVP